MAGMDVEWGPEAAWGSGPRLDEFLLARIAEDERLAAEAPPAADPAEPDGHPSPFDPARVRAECAAKRRIVLACRELRPDTQILGARPRRHGRLPAGAARPAPARRGHAGPARAALCGHHDYRAEWRP